MPGQKHPAHADTDEAHLARLVALRPDVEGSLGGSAHASALPVLDRDHHSAAAEVLTSWRDALRGQQEDSRERHLDYRVFAASLELYRFADEAVPVASWDADVVSLPLELLLTQLRGHAPSEPERFTHLAARLRALGAHVVTARAQVTTPTEPLLARAHDVASGAGDILRAIAEAARQAGAGGQIGSGLADDVTAAVRDAANALDEHRRFLQALVPVPHPVLGLERYDDLLRLRGLDLNAAEVLDLGRSVAEEMRVEAVRTRRRGFKGKTLDESYVAARAHAPSTLSEAIAWASQLADSARAFLIENGVVPVPQGETLRIDAMPQSLSSSGATALLLPPQRMAARQDSVLLLRDPPAAQSYAELSVADLENLVARTGYPGRHVLLATADRLTSVARRGAALSAFGAASTWGDDMLEGWPAYAEELMRELQFRHSPATRLVMIRRGLEAALLTVCDVCLAMGRLTPDGAADLLVRRAGTRPQVAAGLVRGLLRRPTSGVSALVGKVRIEQLRREARKRWRERYTDRAFHAMVLSAGPIPLAYLFELIDDELPDIDAHSATR